MEDLLNGQAVTVNFDEQMVFEQLDYNENAIWSLLLASGYLKAEEVEYRGITLKPWYQLRITNLETVSMFDDMFRGWFEASEAGYSSFVKALMQGDLETAGLAFGRLSAQFIRDKVVPELDAFRFASYCGISGVTKKEETLADGAATVAALSAAVTAMDDEEVTATGRYLFITPTLLQGINDMDTTKSKKVLEGFEQVIKVPQRRFYTAIKQLSGKTGEEAGGYTKATGAANINFAIVQKDALIQYTKHAAPKIIAPENNPDADAYVFGYRMVGIAKAYKNMLSGMYFSHDKA